MNGKLDFGKCLLLDVYNLPYAVYLSPDETQPKSNDGYFIFVIFEVGKVLMFVCVCSKRKCTGNPLNLKWKSEEEPKKEIWVFIDQSHKLVE